MIITRPSTAPPGPLAFQPNRQHWHHHRSTTAHHVAKRGRNHDRAPTVASASIPLPKSHVHRTRSELQLADDVERAEFEDARMCVRLVVGMQSQCIKSGYVHPLTQQSLHEVLRTKAANERELEGKLRDYRHPHAAVAEQPKDDDDNDDEWEVAYRQRANDHPETSYVKSPCHPMEGTPIKSSFSPLVRIPSDGSMLPSTSSEGYLEEDDDCLFDLEL